MPSLGHIRPNSTLSQALTTLLLSVLSTFVVDAAYLPQLSLALPSTAFPNGHLSTTPSLSSFIISERSVAYRGVLENIDSSGAVTGIVIASPSRSNPDCK